MKHIHQIVLTLAAILAFALPGRAVVLLDDTWADGNRTNQNLPSDSIWFTSVAANMAAYINALSATNNTSSAQWYTYFTPNGSPVHLGVGDTLTVTLSFTPIGVGPQNTSKNLRVGLYNSAGSRATADAGVPTGTYLGYALFSNFGVTWGASPDVRKRTAFAQNDPLNATGDSTVIGSNPLVSGTTAFSNNVPYSITISIARTDDTTNIVTVTYAGGGLTNSVTGTDSSGIYTNFDMIEIRPSNAQMTATNFVFSEFKVVGPAGTPDAPSIVTDTKDVTVEVAETAGFNVAAAGASPLRYQWYFNNTSTPLAGATNASLLLTNVQSGQAGGYFAIITNSLGSVTSSVATLTVNVPAFTSRGVIVDDTWADGSHNDPPVTSSNSVWYASASGSFVASPNLVQGLPDPATSRLWVGYFTEDPNTPVDLAVGDAIKVTLVFTPTSVAPQNTSSLRFGLFNYANGATRLSQDDSSSPGSIGNGANVRGYLYTQNFGTNFGDDTPMEIYARNNLASADLMGSTADYLSLGAGPAGSLNAPAFTNGTQYSLTFTVSRTTATSIRITAKITGGNLNISLTDTDSTYAYRRFDAFGIRPNRTTDSAGELDINEFKVEVIAAPIAVTPFSITSVNLLSPGAVKLTWASISGQNYQVQSSDSLAPVSWVTNGTVTATSAATSFTNSPIAGNVTQRYYRVVATP